MLMTKKGMVCLVGAGPGDPGLLTLKGEARLKNCEVVVYDRLASDSLLDKVSEECEKIYVGKESGCHSFSQEDINRILVTKAQEGKKVVRLKGGDPFVFGRGGEEVLALQKAKISYEVIPGITSAIAAAAYAGIPVTHRGVSQSFHVITGHTGDFVKQHTGRYKTLAKLEGTLIFLMGMGNLSGIVKELIKYGKDENTPAAVISNGTTDRQKSVKGTLGTMERLVLENQIKAPAVIIIGDVAGFDMAFSIKGELSGMRIGVTGTRKLADKLISQLTEHGANAVNLSFLQVKEFSNNRKLEEVLNNRKDFTWILFTSANGVDVFFEYLKQYRIDYRKLAHFSFAVVGKGTEEALLKKGFYADYIPAEYSTVSLAEGLSEILKREDRVLIPRAENGSKDLTDILTGHQIPFTEIKTYTIEVDEEKRAQVISDLSGFDYITFASASGAEGFFHNMTEDVRDTLKDISFICIGTATADKLTGYGVTNYRIAKESSVTGIVDCILENVK